MSSADPFNLRRFVEAQEPVYDEVCEELRRGSKETHWMWFVFPQIQGLGRSGTAIYYSISSRAEAESYLKHPKLGARLIECTEFILAVPNRSAEQIFGGIDALKLRSSMTLFSVIAPSQPIFQQAIDKYFHGERDLLTLRRL